MKHLDFNLDFILTIFFVYAVLEIIRGVDFSSSWILTEIIHAIITLSAGIIFVILFNKIGSTIKKSS
jgi:hypothetical protein